MDANLFNECCLLTKFFSITVVDSLPLHHLVQILLVFTPKKKNNSVAANAEASKSRVQNQ